MLFMTFFTLCVLTFIFYKFFLYKKPEEHKSDNIFQFTGSKYKKDTGSFKGFDLDENILKQEFLIFFKEIYQSFSTGQLGHISSKMSSEILDSLKESIKARDEAKFTHTFNGEPSCSIKDISVSTQNVVSIKAEFKSEQVISVEENKIVDNVVDLFVFEKPLNQKNEPWRLVYMG